MPADLMNHPDTFHSAATLRSGNQTVSFFRLDSLEKEGISVARLPYSLRILLENLLRNEDGRTVTAEDIRFLGGWDPKAEPSREIAYMPARVLMQDFTGVPAIVDLAAMRDAMRELGGDPEKINPLQPAELVIDHSVQVDEFGTEQAYDLNAALEFQRNRERYAFLKWGQTAFRNFSAVPPGMGICHQVNLEYLARVVFTTQPDADGKVTAYPDTLVGTDSHTTMVNGLGVLGWGVGGIEAEAAMLGQPVSMLVPQVVGFRLTGKLKEGTTATDLVLTVTEMLRKHGVVGKFVEFYGPGIAELPLADRATIANMAPEYGATCGIFPVDKETLKYLRLTGRSEEQIALVRGVLPRAGAVPYGGCRRRRSTRRRCRWTWPRWSRAWPDRSVRRIVCCCRRRRRALRSSCHRCRVRMRIRTAARQMVRWEGEGGHASATGDVTSGIGTPAPAVPTTVQVITTTHDDLPPVIQQAVLHEPMTSVQERFGVDPEQYLRRRIDRDCGDYVVHKYVESVRDDGRGSAGEEGGGEGAADAAVGEDLAGSGIARGDGLLHAGGAAAVPGSAAISGGGVWVHDVHRQLGAAADRCIEGDRRALAGGGERC